MGLCPAPSSGAAVAAPLLQGCKGRAGKKRERAQPACMHIYAGSVQASTCDAGRWSRSCRSMPHPHHCTGPEMLRQSRQAAAAAASTTSARGSSPPRHPPPLTHKGQQQQQNKQTNDCEVPGPGAAGGRGVSAPPGRGPGPACLPAPARAVLLPGHLHRPAGGQARPGPHGRCHCSRRSNALTVLPALLAAARASYSHIPRARAALSCPCSSTSCRFCSYSCPH